MEVVEGALLSFHRMAGIREKNFTAEMTLELKDGERVELMQGPKAGRAWELGRGIIEVAERERVRPLDFLTCPVVPQTICWDTHPFPPLEVQKGRGSPGSLAEVRGRLSAI